MATVTAMVAAAKADPPERLGPEQRALVEAHDEIARSLANHYRWAIPAGSFDDLLQAAREALCRAALRFDSRLGSFGPFAWTHVRGALLHALRDDRLIRCRVRDGTRERWLRIEIEPVDDDDERHATDGREFDRADARATLAALDLPPRERIALLLRGAGLTQAEIAVRMGAARRSVTRWQARAILRIRERGCPHVFRAA